MTYRGRIKNGVVILEGDPDLPEGTLVQVAPVEDHPLLALARAVESLPAQEDWPADGAAQVDHYLYGTPKQDA